MRFKLRVYHGDGKRKRAIFSEFIGVFTEKSCTMYRGNRTTNAWKKQTRSRSKLLGSAQRKQQEDRGAAELREGEQVTGSSGSRLNE